MCIMLETQFLTFKLCRIIKNSHVYSVTFLMLKMEKIKVEHFELKLSPSLFWCKFYKIVTVNLVIIPAIFHWGHINRVTWVMDPTLFTIELNPKHLQLTSHIAAHERRDGVWCSAINSLLEILLSQFRSARKDRILTVGDCSVTGTHRTAKRTK